MEAENEKGSLKAESLCMIIDRCGKNGVREITLSAQGLDIAIQFGPEIPDIQAVMGNPPADVIPVKDEVDVRDEQLNQMMIEDPAEYENQIVQGETDA
jgi:hypothetical protein